MRRYISRLRLALTNWKPCIPFPHPCVPFKRLIKRFQPYWIMLWLHWRQLRDRCCSMTRPAMNCALSLPEVGLQLWLRYRSKPVRAWQARFLQAESHTILLSLSAMLYPMLPRGAWSRQVGAGYVSRSAHRQRSSVSCSFLSSYPARSVLSKSGCSSHWLKWPVPPCIVCVYMMKLPAAPRSLVPCMRRVRRFPLNMISIRS